MKLLRSSAEPIIESNPFKLVERVGRTCYKSENLTTDTSCYDFVANRIKEKHFAMLEHGVLYCEILIRGVDFMETLNDLTIPYVIVENVFGPQFNDIDLTKSSIPIRIVVSLSHLFNPQWKSRLLKEICDSLYAKYKDAIAGTKLAALKPELDGPRIYSIKFHQDPWFNENRFFTYHFIVDRGVSHELVRHRCAVAQESTRYCNYSKDKFGGCVQFIYPSSWEKWPQATKDVFCETLEKAEDAYLKMLAAGHTPQEARAVLPNALKTEVMMTMPRKQWKHFINLRSIGTTGAPHPDMRVVANTVADDFNNLCSN